MITVQDALQLIEDNKVDLGTESLALSQSQGRILAENIFADRPLPPYDRVTMDGIAINYEGYLKSTNILRIAGIAPAGVPQTTLSDPQECVEVMTGAVLPIGADTIIRYEDLQIENGFAKVLLEKVVHNKNVHQKGSDVEVNTLLIASNTRIRPHEIGIAASVGKHYVSVKKNPKTVIISTGDELVDINQLPAAHQIRRSNTSTISSLLSQWNIAADQVHLPDDKNIILSKLESILDNYELVILTGGVSKGKFDFIPTAMTELGVEQLFHKLKQRPGKPLWFGRKSDIVVFGLPGNPVSSFVCTRKFIFHWLQKSLGSIKAVLLARLISDVTFKPDLHYFLPIHLSTSAEGVLYAHPNKGNGSGDFVNLKNVNAFMELPRGKEVFKAGEVFPVLLTN